MLGLYIHIPFCVSKCRYCDFYSFKADDELKTSYINALIKQIDEYSIQARDYTVDTIYIGGGTPTSIDFSLLSKLIKKVKSEFKIQKNAEFTIEINPGTIDSLQLKKLYKLGVNRLSIGLQSVHNNELNLLGRTHSFKDFENCFENAKEAQFENISIDVMYGLPSQTMQSLFQTLNTIVNLKPTHISLYGLTIERGTYFENNRENFSFPDEKTEVEMYFKSIDFLESKNYSQYEISNFAMKGNISRHNMKYWNLNEYIGLGVAAHSYFMNCRYSLVKDVRKYINHFQYDNKYLDKLDVFDLNEYSLFDEYIEVKPHERIGEYVMLQFRLTNGINTNTFAKNFYKDFESIYYEKMQPFLKNGFIVKTDFGYRFSRKGMYVSNYILSRIIDFEEKS